MQRIRSESDFAKVKESHADTHSKENIAAPEHLQRFHRNFNHTLQEFEEI